jgi:hypothetical protein
MKKVFRISVLVIALVTIVSVVGCSSGSKEIAPAKARAVSMMQMLPSNITAFSFFDKYALTTNKNLSSEWSYYNENYFGFGNDSLSNSINGLCVVYPNNIVMYEGDFTLDQFMGSDTNGSYNYGGFNVRYGAYNSSVVLINNTAITGADEDVRNCIDVVNGNESSFYDNENVKAIVDRLPVGYEMDLGYVGNESSSENISGLLLEGVSVAKSGDNDIETDIYQFNTSDAAQQYVATASNVSKDGTMQIARTQDGVFVTEVITPLTSTPTPTVSPTETSTPTPTS